MDINKGDDVTIISIGPMTLKASQAAKKLNEKGVGIDLIDLLSLAPIDEDTIINSLKKTGRAVIVDEARDICSAASHISAILSDKAFKYLKSPIKRVTVKDVAIPYSPTLESHVIPEVEDIVNCVEELLESN